jgi:predicted Zn finger-like uncharacterized protein
MKEPDTTAATASPTHSITTRCPSCRASLVITTPKSADVATYSRCAMCGEVWNAARALPERHTRQTWR